MKMSKGRTYTEAEVRAALDSQWQFTQGINKAYANITGWGEYNRGFFYGLLAGALLPLTLLAWLGFRLWERWHK